uniref:Uncharacterized protein n=1 Tax=Anguilla anguilla TaxID=7936 RepID=A0A0E9XCR5_ANGAN
MVVGPIHTLKKGLNGKSHLCVPCLNTACPDKISSLPLFMIRIE